MRTVTAVCTVLLSAWLLVAPQLAECSNPAALAASSQVESLVQLTEDPAAEEEEADPEEAAAEEAEAAGEPEAEDLDAESSLEAQIWQKRFSQVWPAGDEDDKLYTSKADNIGFIEAQPRSLRLHARVKATAAGTSGILVMLGPNRGTGGCGGNLRLSYQDKVGGKGTFVVDLVNGEVGQELIGQNVYVMDQTYTVDVTIDEEKKRIELWVNGVKDASGLREFELYKSANVGALSQCPDNEEEFEGEVSDVKVFSGSSMPEPPIFSYPGKLSEPKVAAATLEQIPEQIRIHLRLRFNSESPNSPLVLIGGSPNECSNAIQLSLEAGAPGDPEWTIAFGVAGRSPHALRAKGLKSGQSYVIDCAYNQQTRTAKIFINDKLSGTKQDLWGGDALRGESMWQYPVDGMMSLLSTCHTAEELLKGYVSDVRLYSTTMITGGSSEVVQCEVGPWTEFGECSAQCAGGSQSRSRAVLVDAHNGGKTCPNTHETRDCNTQGCSINACFSGNLITSGCTAKLQNAFRTAPRARLKPLVGFGIGGRDGKGWPPHGQQLDAKYATSMAQLDSPTASCADFKELSDADKAAGNDQPELAGVFVADLKNNRVVRWNKATNEVHTIVADALGEEKAKAAGVEPMLGEEEAEAAGVEPLRAIGIEPNGVRRIIFSASASIEAYNTQSGALKTLVGTGQAGDCQAGDATMVKMGGTQALVTLRVDSENSVMLYGDKSGALMSWDSKTGLVAIVAGRCGAAGLQDGSALEQARVGSNMRGLAVQTAVADDGLEMIQAVYFTDAEQHVLRRLQWVPAAEGTQMESVHIAQLLSEETVARAQVVTLAGTASEPGFLDSIGHADGSLFNTPTAAWVQWTEEDIPGVRVYVLDSRNGVVRLFNPSDGAVNTLLSLPHASSFQMVQHNAAVSVSRSSAQLFEVDLTSNLDCDAIQRVLEPAFKDWEPDPEADPTAEQSLSATASLQLHDARRMGLVSWDFAFHKKVIEVTAGGIDGAASVGKLSKHLICFSQTDAAQEQCCVRKFAAPTEGQEWPNKKKDLRMW